MPGWARNGNLYPTSGVYGIDDNVVSSNTGWSSKKIMNKLANVKSIIRVDEKPTITDDTVTYIKDGTSYTTTDTETWFYYIIDDLLYKTTFIDGVEYTKDDSSVDFDNLVAKTDIITTLDNTVTDEQVPSAKMLLDGRKVLPYHISGGNSEYTETDIFAIADNYQRLNTIVFAEKYSCRVFIPTNAPDGITDCYVDFRFMQNENWIGLTLYDVRTTNVYECRKIDGTWSEWVCVKSDEWKDGTLITEVSEKYPQNVLYFPVGKFRFAINDTVALFTELPTTKAGILEVKTIDPNKDLTTHAYAYRLYHYVDYRLNEFVRYINTANTAGVISNDSGWLPIGKGNFTDITQLNLEKATCTLMDIITALPVDSTLTQTIDNANTLILKTECPYIYGTLTVIKKENDRIKLFFFPNSDANPNELYFSEYHPTNGLQNWSKVCSTKVADVDRTTFSSPEDARIDASNTLFYYVKNGVCNIIFSGIKLTSVSGTVDSYRIGKVPVPLAGYAHTALSYSMSAETNSSIVADVGGDGGLTIYVDKNAKTNVSIWGTLRYDVAEG